MESELFARCAQFAKTMTDDQLLDIVSKLEDDLKAPMMSASFRGSTALRLSAYEAELDRRTK